MKFEIHNSFVKGAKKLPAETQREISEIIEEIGKAKNIREVKNCKN